MTGLPPWYTTDREKLFRRLKSAPLDIPPFFLPQAVSFVSGLLERDPRRRLGVKGVKSVIGHEFFRGLDFRDLLDRKIEPPIRPCEGWKLPDSDKNSQEFSMISASKMINGSSEINSQLPSKELDTATQNFDQSFTRMPVDSVSGQDEGNPSSDLTENVDILNSFLGFTYDERKKTEDQDDDPSLSGRFD
jgi:serine/threonine protein kinase